jgi:prepilin-type N-terminal cleavage/methylation domain-containing protein
MKAKIKGFSLLEMITVLAIVAIITSLMVVGVSAHKEAVLTAKTRVQFMNYASAINMYCREYGDLPSFFRDEELIPLCEGNNSETFVKILSGLLPNGRQLSATERQQLNPLGKTFYNFPNDEFFVKSDGVRDRTVLADAFNNKNIFVIVEDPFDNDTIIARDKFPECVKRIIKSGGVKSQVVIFSVSDDERRVISNCSDF